METIRKFGLEYCDLPTMLSNVTTMLNYLALDVDPRHKRASIVCHFFLIIMSACYYYVYLVSMLWFVFWRCRETEDMLSAVIVFSLGVSSEISMTKFLCIFAQRNNVRKLIKAYLNSDSKVIPNTRFAANIKKTLRAVKKRAIIVWNVIIWNGIVYVTIPLGMSDRQFMQDGFEFYGFNNMTSMKVSPNYEIAYTINCVAVYTTCFPAANISAFFIIVAGYIEAQMLALSVELTSLWEDALKHCDSNFNITSNLREPYGDLSNITDVYEEVEGPSCKSYTASIVRGSTKTALTHIRVINDLYSSDTSSTDSGRHIKRAHDLKTKLVNKFIKERLETIIKSHTICINLLLQTERIFKIAIAFEFLLLIIGLIAELLGGLENTYIQLPYALMSVGIDCFTGQRIKDASMVFQTAVYDSKWENFDVSNRKMILMMLRSSQKVMKLSAGGIATLSLECLMGVLRMTYSAYTTLRTTMK